VLPMLHVKVGDRNVEVLLRVRQPGDEIMHQRPRFLHASKLAKACEKDPEPGVETARAHPKLTIMDRLLVVLLVIMNHRDGGQKGTGLRIVRVQTEAAQQSVQSFSEVSDIDVVVSTGRRNTLS
jgi:hypothetical protein